jgi:hypothetical protein
VPSRYSLLFAADTALDFDSDLDRIPQANLHDLVHCLGDAGAEEPCASLLGDSREDLLQVL